MKLKYYLRGIGIGIVITTMIFMILISLRKENSSMQKMPVQNTESQTVAKFQNSTEQEFRTEDAPSDMPKPAGTESGQKDSDGQEMQVPDTQKETESKQQPETVSETAEAGRGKIRLEIRGGQSSDTVSRNLAAAGLVDDAEKFNDFLIQKNYDNSILPGVYEIPKGSAYEEIAVLLTTKVE